MWVVVVFLKGGGLAHYGPFEDVEQADLYQKVEVSSGVCAKVFKVHKP